MTVRGADYPRRKNDDYPTPPEVLDTLFDNVELGPRIWDPACGRLKRVITAARRHGLSAGGSDIIFKGGNSSNFLNMVNGSLAANDVVTNPPFGDRRGSLALHFIEKALEVTQAYHSRSALLLPIDFDSAKTRQHVFQHPAFALKLVLLDRIKWFNGQSGATNFAWYIWDWKHKGPPVIWYARIEDGKQVAKKRKSNRTGDIAPAARRRAHR